MEKVTSIGDLPEVIREALCCHEAFRRLGFTPDQIEVGSGIDARTSQRGLFVRLHPKDQEKPFIVTLGRCDWAPEDLNQVWLSAIELFKTRPEAELQELWKTSGILREAAGLVAALHARGIAIPRSEKKHLN